MRCKMEPKYRTVIEVENVEDRERKIRNEWTKRVTEKMERIKGTDYERQIEKTLSQVEKIRTEL